MKINFLSSVTAVLSADQLIYILYTKQFISNYNYLEQQLLYFAIILFKHERPPPDAIQLQTAVELWGIFNYFQCQFELV